MLNDLRQIIATGSAELPAIRCALMKGEAIADPVPDVAELIDLIQTRYHQTHRREFPEAIALARGKSRPCMPRSRVARAAWPTISP